MLIVDYIVHPLNFFIDSARMPEAIRLAYVTFFIFILCIDSDGVLKQSIRNNVIDLRFGIFFFFFHDCDNCFSKLFTGQWCAVTVIMLK